MATFKYKNDIIFNDKMESHARKGRKFHWGFRKDEKIFILYGKEGFIFVSLYWTQKLDLQNCLSNFTGIFTRPLW